MKEEQLIQRKVAEIETRIKALRAEEVGAPQSALVILHAKPAPTR